MSEVIMALEIVGALMGVLCLSACCIAAGTELERRIVASAEPAGSDREEITVVTEDHDNTPPLIKAIKTEKFGYVNANKLIAEGADVNCRDSQGRTPLMHAVTRWSWCEPEVMPVLLDKYALVNDRDNKGKTALMYLAMHHDTRLKYEVKFTALQGKSVGINLQDREGKTALWHAITAGVGKMVELLTPHADLRIIGPGGYTVLMKAVTIGNPEIIKVLINRAKEDKTNFTITDDNGDTALMLATGLRDEKTIKSLVPKHTEDINLKNTEDKTALMLYSRTTLDKIVAYLLKKGADPTLEDLNGYNSFTHWTQGRSANVGVLKNLLSGTREILKYREGEYLRGRESKLESQSSTFLGKFLDIITKAYETASENPVKHATHLKLLLSCVTVLKTAVRYEHKDVKIIDRSDGCLLDLTEVIPSAPDLAELDTTPPFSDSDSVESATAPLLG